MSIRNERSGTIYSSPLQKGKSSKKVVNLDYEEDIDLYCMNEHLG